MRYMPEPAYQEVKENYEHFIKRVSLYRSKGLDFQKSRRFILEKAHPIEGSILEIGTGTGYTTVALAEKNLRFISIDKDKEALKTAALNLAHKKLLSNVELYVMDGAAMSFKSAGFNNIICVNLFHHISGIDKMLAEIDRVLCLNGRVILADFNRKGIKIVEQVHSSEGRMHADSGVSEDYVCSYFRALGYEVKRYGEECHWALIGKKLLQQ
jgi:ubiquinone/menaquinone biosynthesis C-methylase UbiE